MVQYTGAIVFIYIISILVSNLEVQNSIRFPSGNGNARKLYSIITFERV